MTFKTDVTMLITGENEINVERIKNYLEKVFAKKYGYHNVTHSHVRYSEEYRNYYCRIYIMLPKNILYQAEEIEL
jgi:hypothetical protein